MTRGVGLVQSLAWAWPLTQLCGLYLAGSHAALQEGPPDHG